MNTLHDMGEAMLLAQEGGRLVALALANGARRLARKGLALLGVRHAAPGRS